ncbi:biotin synthase BioB [Candidatus Methylomirabilis sp.]|uniref:biotin synthase BioB n=1 Tax=Candidatus Methylomirabilis sp. TaxID=2032687 RepID=UPI002A5FE384|nr:biotin synthase BioB [Candidatus Methylomirabilis sp.]
MEVRQSSGVTERVQRIGERVLAGDAMTFEEAVELFERSDYDVHELFHVANRLRLKQFGNRIHLCSIINAKSGACLEDCGFCSQSVYHATRIPSYGMVSPDEMVGAGRKAQGNGASALGVVTAGRGYAAASADFRQLIEGIRAIAQDGWVEGHASLGIMGDEEFRQLKAAGLTTFNHNLETGRSYFPKVCTTHTYDERVRTIKAAKAAGIRTCSGGIIGMGEEPMHRAELAFALKELDVDEVPLNFLVSVDGTRLEKAIPPPPLEMLKAIALFRWILPTKNIFICAGRAHLGDLQSMIFFAGASGMMVGDFLTTKNRSVSDDLKMVRDLGLDFGGPLFAQERQGVTASIRLATGAAA